MEKYPVGIQTFQVLREEGYIYVDKTQYIYSLVKTGKYYFLSRPRRFGKSLFLTTLKSFFEGRRDLFKGLYIDGKEDVEWDERPVIHIDFTGEDFTAEGALKSRLDIQLSNYERAFGLTEVASTSAGRFMNVISSAYEKTGKKVTVLIDEYDKPILDTLHLHDLQEKYRNTLSGFYSVLKATDQFIYFCFLTGVSKFRNLNIFSGLNNLQIISIDKRYDGICGITEEELLSNFTEGIGNLAKSEGVSYERAVTLLKRNYDGYHFAAESADIYNPFSVLNALAKSDIQPFWFYSGTPSFLIRFLKNKQVRLQNLENALIDQLTLVGANSSSDDVISLLYQSGYLTIKCFDKSTKLYTLGYPNLEVEESMMKVLLPAYTNISDSDSVFEINKFSDDLKRGRVDDFMERLNSFFYDFPYENVLDVEKHFQNVVYIIAKLLGFNVNVEYHTARGRIDLLIRTKDYIYIIEMKRDESPETALRQIEEKGYAHPFESDYRQLIKIGIEFSTTKRCITSWKIDC